MEKQKISVIVPVYNASKTLKRCVDSIINQTYKNYEIILVNDGSLDSSLEICKKYASDYKNIVVVDKENGGASSARNEGLKRAKGYYVSFVDSDDEIPDNFLELLSEKFYDDIDMVVCPIKIVGAQQRDVDFCSYGEIKLNEDVDFWKQTNFYGLMASPCNKLYLRAKILEEFPVNITYGEDAIFNISYLKNCQRINVVKDISYNYYYENSQSVTKKFSKKRFEDSLVVRQALKSLLEKFCVDNEGVENRFLLRDICSIIKSLTKCSTYTFKEKKLILSEMLSHRATRECFSKYNAKSISEKIAFLLIKLKFKNLLYLCCKLI